MTVDVVDLAVRGGWVFFFLTFADHCGITTLHDALYVRMRALLTQTYTHIQRKRGARGRGRRRRGEREGEAGYKL